MNNSVLKTATLSVQHVLAMFGATILVPLLTGLPVSVTLLSAGLGTLIFHAVTGGHVPVFLGSSFAFIGGILAVGEALGLAYATGAIIVASIVYLLGSVAVMAVGYERFSKLFPPIVVAPIIITIGLTLAPTAVDMASSHWLVAIITIATAGIIGIYGKGFVKLIPVVGGVIIGYIIASLFGLVDISAISNANWLAMPEFMAPKFSLYAITIIAPLALVTMIEHIGDITTNGAVVGKDFAKKPGLHRTLLGDGLATGLAGLLGAPANTTYSENTGTLAITKVYDAKIIRYAALIAIVMAFSGKLVALIQTIPTPVLGGISFILFGMIANIGVRQLVDNRVNLRHTRNAIVFFVPLICGLTSPAEGLGISGLALAAILAIVLNLVLPNEKETI